MLSIGHNPESLGKRNLSRSIAFIRLVCDHVSEKWSRLMMGENTQTTVDGAVSWQVNLECLINLAESTQGTHMCV